MKRCQKNQKVFCQEEELYKEIGIKYVQLGHKVVYNISITTMVSNKHTKKLM